MTIFGEDANELITISEAAMERHTASDEIYQAMPETRQDFALQADGLPAPINIPDTEDAAAPALHPSTLVCMADTSEFVIRDLAREIVKRFKPEEVTRLADGLWYVKHDDVTDLDTSVADLIPHVHSRGMWWAQVEPLRPQCRHYARQKVDFPYNPQSAMVARLCTARRDSDGMFLSVSNSRCLACELRDPPDLDSVVRELDAFDEEKVRQGLERTREGNTPLFKLDTFLKTAEERSVTPDPETDPDYEPNG